MAAFEPYSAYNQRKRKLQIDLDHSLDQYESLIDDVEEADVHVGDKQALLNVAVYFGRLYLVRKLLKLGADPRHKVEGGREVLEVAGELCSKHPDDERRLDVLELLRGGDVPNIEAPAEPDYVLGRRWITVWHENDGADEGGDDQSFDPKRTFRMYIIQFTADIPHENLRGVFDCLSRMILQVYDAILTESGDFPAPSRSVERPVPVSTAGVEVTKVDVKVEETSEYEMVVTLEFVIAVPNTRSP